MDRQTIFLIVMGVFGLIIVLLRVAKILSTTGMIILLAILSVIVGRTFWRKWKDIEKGKFKKTKPDIELIKEINAIAEQDNRPQIDLSSRRLWESEWKTFTTFTGKEIDVFAILSPKKGGTKRDVGLWRYDVTNGRISFNNNPPTDIIKNNLFGVGTHLEWEPIKYVMQPGFDRYSSYKSKRLPGGLPDVNVFNMPSREDEQLRGREIGTPRKRKRNESNW